MDNGSKTKLIVGLGKTGASVARFLHRNGTRFMATDSRAHPPAVDEFRRLYPQAAIHLGEFDENLFCSADEIVLSPGVALKTPAVQSALTAGVPVIGDIELFSRALDDSRSRRAPVVAVTGSNGKSTVTTLVAEMAERAGLKVAAGGNLGVPALDLLSDNVELYALELSSFQLEVVHSLRPAASVILNISADHFDRYASFDDYACTKQRIHRNTQTAVLNREDSYPLKLDPVTTTISFGLGVACEGQFGITQRDGGLAIAYGTEPWLSCRELKGLPGSSGVLNAQAALALGYAIDLPRPAMCKTLRHFNGLAHRRQTLGMQKGVTWINDSKATNVAAALAALTDMREPCVWIAGGDGKGADFSSLRSAMDRVRTAILIGRDAPVIADAVESAVPVQFAQSFDDAIARARDAAREGDCILLSPGCSSLDMFSSYMERGERFMHAFEKAQGDVVREVGR